MSKEIVPEKVASAAEVKDEEQEKDEEPEATEQVAPLTVEKDPSLKSEVPEEELKEEKSPSKVSSQRPSLQPSVTKSKPPSESDVKAELDSLQSIVDDVIASSAGLEPTKSVSKTSEASRASPKTSPRPSTEPTIESPKSPRGSKTSEVPSSKRSSAMSSQKQPHLSFFEPRETEKRPSTTSDTVDIKRPSTISRPSKRFSVQDVPSQILSLQQEAKTSTVPTSELLDILKRLPKATLDRIQEKSKGKVGFLLNLVNLLNSGKYSRAEVSSKENIQLTPTEIKDLVEIVADEYREGLIGDLMNTVKPVTIQSRLRSDLPKDVKEQLYSIPAVELLDVFNRLPKEDLDKIHQENDFIFSLNENAAKAEISSQKNFDLTGEEVLDLVDVLPEDLLKSLIDEENTFGEILREFLKETRPLPQPSKAPEMDPATQKALKMKEKIEERSKKINEMKGHLQYYLSKTRKDADDRKKIQMMKCEIQCATDCLKATIKEFIKLQKNAKIDIQEPIMLATSLDEDEMPKCLEPSKSDQKRCLTPSAVKNIEKRRSNIRSQTKMATDNSTLARERCHLQSEILNRDRIVENLQQNLQVMQCELTKMTHENMKLSKKIDCLDKPKETPVDVECRLKAYKENADALEQNITKMALALNQLQLELTGVERDRDSLEKNRPFTCPRSVRNDKEDVQEENRELKEQYAMLLQEFSRKEREIKDLNDKLRRGIEAEQCSSPERVELGIVRKQLNELLDEQEEFKIIIKEQATQVEEYRDKFMQAQQTVEEQRREMEMQEVNNSQIEQQINCEIQRIKNEFQKKLREFTPLPQMLENEQLKVHELQKKSRGLEEKLLEYGMMVKEAEERANELHGKYRESNVGVIDELKGQVEMLQEQVKEGRMERDRLEDNLHDEKYRYETLRGETAKIIQRANDRHETSRKLAHDHLSKLENDLAKAKADASCDATLHESTVNKITNQMRILTHNFDEAQSQIKSLQNQIQFLSSKGEPSTPKTRTPRTSFDF